ncbi:MAG: hypothetical protein QM711_12745 [Micropruina sp.]|uniref:hypothetical protein n=1 Tax=Micropruina sp. TaxID=2737536 RepID=UPI0039E43BDA
MAAKAKRADGLLQQKQRQTGNERDDEAARQHLLFLHAGRRRPIACAVKPVVAPRRKLNDTKMTSKMTADSATPPISASSRKCAIDAGRDQAD